MPVFPENIPMKCRFDASIATWRCDPVGLLEQPRVLTIIAGVVAIGALGYLMGNILPLKKFVK
jgi:hypothetical protein